MYEKTKSKSQKNKQADPITPGEISEILMGKKLANRSLIAIIIILIATLLSKIPTISIPCILIACMATCYILFCTIKGIVVFFYRLINYKSIFKKRAKNGKMLQYVNHAWHIVDIK